jgi:S1-C subfamily serine protease
MVADDVVVKVDGTAIRNVADLVVAVRLQQPGDRVQVTVNRKQNARKMTVVLGAAEIEEGAEPAAVVSTG